MIDLMCSFLGGEQRESWTLRTQGEARLCAKDRQCAGAGAICTLLAVLKHELEEIVVLPHPKNL